MVDVRVEMAVCELLLGRKDSAAAELGLSDNAERLADPGIQDFVQVPSMNALKSKLLSC